jgi:cytochrome P450
MGSRADVVEMGLVQMSRELRSLIAYEPNGSLDLASPQPLLDEIRRTRSVVRWELGVGFFGMEDVRAACRNPDLVSMNPETGVNFGMGSRDPLIPLHLDGPRHVRFRKLLSPLFTSRKMALLEPAIRDLADRLIDAFADRGRADLHEAFCVPLPSTVFLTLFGMPLADLPFLTAIKDRILKNEGKDRVEHEAIGLAAGVELDEHLRARLHQRLVDGGRYDDLLDAFIHLEVDGHSLREDEVVNLMHMFTIAGLDTVTSSLSCIIGFLAAHPSERRRLVADPSRLARAVEELLRYESPVHSGGARWAVRDTEINGVRVKKGEMVYLCWATANLDPAYFDKPLEPDLARSYVPHVAFAVGTHHCLGSHLARTELRVAVDQLHRRIPDYRVPDGEEIRYEFASVRQARYLPLEFGAR